MTYIRRTYIDGQKLYADDMRNVQDGIDESVKIQQLMTDVGKILVVDSANNKLKLITPPFVKSQQTATEDNKVLKVDPTDHVAKFTTLDVDGCLKIPDMSGEQTSEPDETTNTANVEWEPATSMTAEQALAKTPKIKLAGTATVTGVGTVETFNKIDAHPDKGIQSESIINAGSSEFASLIKIKSDVISIEKDATYSGGDKTAATIGEGSSGTVIMASKETAHGIEKIEVMPDRINRLKDGIDTSFDMSFQLGNSLITYEKVEAGSGVTVEHNADKLNVDVKSHILSGTSDPAPALGVNGDIYIKFTA